VTPGEATLKMTFNGSQHFSTQPPYFDPILGTVDNVTRNFLDWCAADKIEI
jgi:hypothetical protein